MKKIVLDDILGFAAYEQVREKFRNDIIDKKKKRRIALGRPGSRPVSQPSRR